ncbi:cyclohexanone monooxygenase [Panacagrimonas perspica]|uniref:Cyclohexanone monooxygenase n=1 Tax=Panacagrimonas perspica TaxID=381431 RepID=A0A4S3KAX3_9GAMM|nr:NAD(P)/FAD-dependent oxidoreductase [Panacagrimonas perspica]TDU32604.1 cyclohexanone monooxygenase [Panacagrimonas perspica]THD05496.1 cyclohexanone monooxygenase [Panacagrimonas perspica]
MDMPTFPVRPETTYDAIVVGAGFAGLYMLHRLRQMGLKARVYEAGENVGGTWYWNRYPGAACDIESLEYSYSFDEALQQEWKWTSRFARQPEILAYINHVADRFDLRRDIQFGTRVSSAVFDDATRCWKVETNRGDAVTARFCVMATGCLSAPKPIEYPGAETFRGRILRTQAWPREGVDFTGLRVGIVGTGSTGIQCIPIIASQARHLTVFQRTPNFSIPAGNGPMDPAYEKQIKANYGELRAIERDSDVGICARLRPETRRALDVDANEREAEYERRWTAGGLYFYGSFVDLLTDKAANDTITAFAQRKIREKITDPKVADLLVPKDYPFGAKRICADTGYYETFNRDNVSLVDVKAQPIREITPNGLKVGDDEHELDVLIFATGFDAMTGALASIDIRGRDGVKFNDCWKNGPRNHLGLMTSGFPNMFMTTGPGSPSVLYNMVLGNEYHVDWIMGCITYLDRNGRSTIEATPEAEADWRRTVDDIGRQTLFANASSWYMGDNVPGKPRVVLPYLGGFRAYKKTCDTEAESGYPGFAIA